MPRDLPLSNGNLLVNFDSHYNLRDIYYPHVGQANHAHGCRSRLGIWVDGTFEWHETHGWQLDMKYEKDSLVTQVTSSNQDLGVVARVQDAVDFNINVLIRRIEITNTFQEPREVRLFFHLDFSMWGTTVGDTAFYHPERRAIVGYKDNCYLLMNGLTKDTPGLNSWTTEHKDLDQGTGAWQDAEDGVLEKNPVAFGSVDCVGSLHLGQIQPGQSAVVYYWLAFGESLGEVLELDKQVMMRTPDALLSRTRAYWRAWAAKEFVEGSRIDQLPQDFREAYTRSLLMIRAHTDDDGGIIAACDSNISFPYHSHGERTRPVYDPFHGHEHYAYVWPRDGSMAALALVRAGYAEASRQFVRFCARTMSYDPKNDWGYMLQRFHSSGTVGSNVIPWVDDQGHTRLPIQQDETGVVLYLLWEHYHRYRDLELITPLYRRFIKPIGNFLRDYREPQTRLPLPSQDLWEERDGIHAFTVATVWAGLQAAAHFTELFGEDDLARDYRRAAEEIKHASEEYLYDEQEGRFVRTVTIHPNAEVSRDKILDTSLCGLFYFGMFDVDDPRIERTIGSIIQRLSLRTPCGGIARLEGDTYQRVPGEDYLGVPGNAWFICTLWVAQYHIRKAGTMDELEPARKIIEWVKDHSLPSGVLGEQLHPYSGDPVSTSPLTWSHTTLVLTIIEYSERYTELSKRSLA